MAEKCIVNHSKRYGSMRFGMELPVNAVYGTYKGIPWMCVDLNFYRDGKSIDVLFYHRKAEKWKRERLDCGAVYQILTKYMEEHDLVGAEVRYAYRLNGSFQASCPTGKKQKATSLKAANNRHWERGDGFGGAAVII